ncbi:hypothetical protein D3C71_1748090 [compost metagenome]
MLGGSIMQESSSFLQRLDNAVTVECLEGIEPLAWIVDDLSAAMLAILLQNEGAASIGFQDSKY